MIDVRLTVRVFLPTGGTACGGDVHRDWDLERALAADRSDVTGQLTTKLGKK